MKVEESREVRVWVYYGMGNNNRYEEADVFFLSTSKNCSKKSNYFLDFF